MIRDYQALHTFLHERAAMPFDWATNSCVHFAAGAVEAQTGRSILARLPKWKTESGARRQLARAGGLEAACDTVLRRIPAALAQRGDVAGVQDPAGGLFLMVVEGDGLVGVDASGARRVRRERMVMAWSAT